jgi:hypothetical protein
MKSNILFTGKSPVTKFNFELREVIDNNSLADYYIVRRVRKFLFFKWYNCCRKFYHLEDVDTRNIQLYNAKRYMLSICDYLIPYNNG